MYILHKDGKKGKQIYSMNLEEPTFLGQPEIPGVNSNRMI